jgi:hypothetical protein
MSAQAVLRKAIESYVAQGGAIEKLPDFKIKPLPVRSTLESESKHEALASSGIKTDLIVKAQTSKKPDLTWLITDSQVSRIRAMAALGLSVIQIANRVKVPRSAVRALGAKKGFKLTEVSASKKILSKLSC